MRSLFIFLGATGFAVLIFVIGNWYGQPLIARHLVLKRLNRPSGVDRISAKLARRRLSTTKRDKQLERLSWLSDLLDSTARNLRLGKSMAASLQSASAQGAIGEPVFTELVAATTRGESFADATKRLMSNALASEVVFALRTINLAATGGVGGVFALERAAIVLRERSTHINDRQMQAAQAMLSTKVLSWAPVGVAGWLIVTSTSVRNFLILSASGWLCVLLGVGFNFAGRRWMQKIVTPAAT